MTANIIKGKKSICDAVGRSWAVVVGWIVNKDFPAVKLDGVWESHPDLIDEWRKAQILKKP